MEIRELSEIDMAQVSGGNDTDYSYDDQGFRHDSHGKIDKNDPWGAG